MTNNKKYVMEFDIYLAKNNRHAFYENETGVTPDEFISILDKINAKCVVNDLKINGKEVCKFRITEILFSDYIEERKLTQLERFKLSRISDLKEFTINDIIFALKKLVNQDDIMIIEIIDNYADADQYGNLFPTEAVLAGFINNKWVILNNQE